MTATGGFSVANFPAKRLVIHASTDSVTKLFPVLDDAGRAALLQCTVLCSEPLSVKTRHSVLVSSDASLLQTVLAAAKPDVFISMLISAGVQLTPESVCERLSVSVADAASGRPLALETYARDAVLERLSGLLVTLDSAPGQTGIQTAGRGDSTPAVVPLEPALDTAVSVRYKVETAAVAAIAAYLSSAFPCCSSSTATLPSPSPSRAPLEAEALDERQIRAAFDPPRSVAVVELGDGRLEAVEDAWQLRRATQPRPQQQQQGGFFTNVGGSIVAAGTDVGRLLAEKRRLRMNEPLPGVNAARYVSEVLRSGWLGVEGPFVKKLERRFAGLCGGVDAVAVHSGTAALWGALKALEVGPGKAVLCPAFTCAACADAVEQTGGRAVIVDCELDSFGVSFQAVQRAFAASDAGGLAGGWPVVGVVVAPCYGVPARDLLKIRTLCDQRGAFLVEDNCESYGASFCLAGGAGQGGAVGAVGSVGDMAVVSIRSEKMVGVGEGGVITSRSQQLVDKARWWCSRAPTRGVGLWRVYEHDEVGMNYRLPEMLAAIGCAGLENLPVMVSRKRLIHAWYVEELAKRPDLEIRFQQEADGDFSVWWINALVLPERLRGRAEEVGMTLIQRWSRIEIRPGFFPLNKMKPFRGFAASACPNAEELYARMLCLPSSPFLSKDDVAFICEGLCQVLDDIAAATAVETSATA